MCDPSVINIPSFSNAMDTSKENTVNCPICGRSFVVNEIEQHANKCIFLNCPEVQKRKRSPSPIILSQQMQSKLSSNEKSKNVNTKNSNETFKINKKNLASLFEQKPKVGNGCNFSQPESQEDVNNSNRMKSVKNKFSFFVPLAKQMIPNTFDDFFGQSKILGKDTILRNLLEKQEFPNMILWGPPGCGKTSLSTVISDMCKKQPAKYKLISLCATNCGIKEVQNLITKAKIDLKFGKRTILFMDEIHRFNKRQQDVFLLGVEKGEITLIGATTENPSFIINSALLSRCRVIVMEKLDTSDIFSILEKAAEYLEIEVIDSDNSLSIISENNG